VFTVNPLGRSLPSRRHEFALFLDGHWLTLTPHPNLVASSDPVGELDAHLLQEHVLGPIFGIHDPRTSKRLDFIGGTRGTAALEELVKNGRYACAFSMFPASIDELISVADAGGVMPPKSTWFEPKLRDGMFCHLL